MAPNSAVQLSKLTGPGQLSVCDISCSGTYVIRLPLMVNPEIANQRCAEFVIGEIKGRSCIFVKKRLEYGGPLGCVNIDTKEE